MRAIICEGKSDAVLIGYFLSGTFGWQYTREAPLDLPFDRRHEELNWFTHPAKAGKHTAIWGAGGIDAIKPKLTHIVERTRAERRPEYRFELIVLFFDRDNRNDGDCITLIQGWLRDAGLVARDALGLAEWIRVDAELEKTPAERHEFRLIAIVLPHDSPGALETFLMVCLEKNSNDDLRVVQSARQYVQSLPQWPYLSTPRMRPKATLGATLAVFSPDWVFGDLDQRLMAVDWTGIQGVAAAYERFGEL